MKKKNFFTLCAVMFLFLSSTGMQIAQDINTKKDTNRLSFREQVKKIKLSPEFKDITVKLIDHSCVYNRVNYQKFNLSNFMIQSIHVMYLSDVYAIVLSSDIGISDDETFAKVLDAIDPNNLLVLSVIDIPVTDKSIPKLLSFPNIEVINLVNTKISDEGIEILKEKLPSCKINPGLSEVRIPYLLTRIVGDSGLDLSHMRPAFNDENIKKIVHLPITYLNLANTKITSYSIRMLNKISTLESLKIDVIGNLVLDQEDMKSLGNLGNLRELYLKSLVIADDTLFLLAQNHHLKNLWLINCHFNERDFMSFPPESSLELLSVQQNSGVTNNFIDYVMHLKNLRFLDISFSSINDGGIDNLKRMQLRELIIESTKITAEGVKRLVLANPNILIWQGPWPVAPQIAKEHENSKFSIPFDISYRNPKDTSPSQNTGLNDQHDEK